MAVSHTRRSAGEGSLYRTAEGRWRGAAIVTDPGTGHRVRRVVSGKTRADVARKLDTLKKAAGDGVLPSKLTTADYLQSWLESDRASVKASSWRQRDQYVRLYMVPAIGRIPLASLLPSDVERMTSNLIASGKSPRTAAAVRVILRRALRFAVRDGRIARNVAALAEPPKVQARSMEQGRDYFGTEQLRTLLEVCEGHRVGPLVTVAATTGMRQGELLGLRWQDVDLAAGTITVQRSLARAMAGGWELAEPKTRRSRRTINLIASARVALLTEHEWQDERKRETGAAWQDRDGLVFTDAAGRPQMGYNVNRAFHALLRTAGLPSIPFHGLRHSVATALLRAGVALRTVSDMLGHSTIAITADTYGHVVPEVRREAADALERALQP